MKEAAPIYQKLLLIWEHKGALLLGKGAATQVTYLTEVFNSLNLENEIYGTAIRNIEADPEDHDLLPIDNGSGFHMFFFLDT